MVPPNILFIKVNESENMVKMLDFTYINMVTLPAKLILQHPAYSHMLQFCIN